MSGSVALDRVLTEQGIAHSYETYDGDHLSGVADRLVTKVMPFFARQLTIGVSRPRPAARRP